MKAPGAPKTRRARVEQKEQAIITAAHDVFMEHGFDRARVAEIARRAQVAEGTLYLYFEGKEALMHAVASAFYQRITLTAAAGVEQIQSVREQLEFLSLHHLQSCLSEWRIIEMGYASFRMLEGYESSEYFQLSKSYVAVFDGVIRRGIMNGTLRDEVHLSNLRDLFYGGLEYACRTLILRGYGPDDASTVETASRVVDMVWGGIALGPPVESPKAERRLAALTARLEGVAQRLEAGVKLEAE